MRVLIVSPEKVLYSGEVSILRLPGEKGRFEVLDRHAPIISTLGQGSVECDTAGQPFAVDIKKGFVEISQGIATVCVEAEEN